MTFGGVTFEAALDEERLTKQLDRVRACLLRHRGEWLTLSQVAELSGGPEASVSARMRDLRKAGTQVDARRRSGGTWEYRVPAPTGQLELI